MAAADDGPIIVIGHDFGRGPSGSFSSGWPATARMTLLTLDRTHLGRRKALPIWRGTDGSNPSPSSGESSTNPNVARHSDGNLGREPTRNRAAAGASCLRIVLVSRSLEQSRGDRVVHKGFSQIPWHLIAGLIKLG
jgi:hypothetical protein